MIPLPQHINAETLQEFGALTMASSPSSSPYPHFLCSLATRRLPSSPTLCTTWGQYFPFLPDDLSLHSWLGKYLSAYSVSGAENTIKQTRPLSWSLYSMGRDTHQQDHHKVRCGKMWSRALDRMVRGAHSEELTFQLKLEGYRTGFLKK